MKYCSFNLFKAIGLDEKGIFILKEHLTTI